MNNKLKQAFGDWSESANDVKARIYADTIHQQKRKVSYIKPLAAAAVLAVGVSAAVLYNESPNEGSNTTPIVTPIEDGIRTYSDVTQRIMEYEMFYRWEPIYTLEAVKYHSVNDLVNMYTFFYYLQEQGKVWDEEKRQFYRKQVENELAYDLRDASFAAYFERLLEELQISQEQYLEEYALVMKEYEMIRRNIMSENGTGYPNSESYGVLMDKLGISQEYLDQLAENTPMSWPSPDDTWGHLFTDANFSSTDFSEEQYFKYRYVQRDFHLPKLSRFSLDRYIEVLAQDNSAEGKELLAIFEIAKRLFGKELDVSEL